MTNLKFTDIITYNCQQNIMKQMCGSDDGFLECDILYSGWIMHIFQEIPLFHALR